LTPRSGHGKAGYLPLPQIAVCADIFKSPTLQSKRALNAGKIFGALQAFPSTNLQKRPYRERFGSFSEGGDEIPSIPDQKDFSCNEVENNDCKLVAINAKRQKFHTPQVKFYADPMCQNVNALVPAFQLSTPTNRQRPKLQVEGLLALAAEQFSSSVC